MYDDTEDVQWFYNLHDYDDYSSDNEDDDAPDEDEPFAPLTEDLLNKYFFSNDKNGNRGRGRDEDMNEGDNADRDEDEVGDDEDDEDRHESDEARDAGVEESGVKDNSRPYEGNEVRFGIIFG